MSKYDYKGLLTLVGGISIWAMVMALLITLTGCGTERVKVSGSTQNAVNAQAEVTLVLKIDLSTCDEYGTAAKLDCIEAITGAFQSLGDLSKILVCDPKDQAKCDLLSKILAGVK